MAVLAKIFGAFCLVAALATACAGIYLAGSIEWQNLDADEEDVAFVLLLSLGVWVALLAAVGAGAYVVGDVAELAAQDRLDRARERQYGASRR